MGEPGRGRVTLRRCEAAAAPGRVMGYPQLTFAGWRAGRLGGGGAVARGAGCACARAVEEGEEEEVGTFVEFYLRGRLRGVKCARAGAGVAQLGCGARTWSVRGPRLSARRTLWAEVCSLGSWPPQERFGESWLGAIGLRR